MGLGTEGRQVLMRQASLITTALGEYLKTPIRFKFKDGDCRISGLQGLARTYYAPVMVLAKKDRQFEVMASRDQRLTLDAVTPRIRQLVIDGLVGQASYIDQCYRASGHPELADLESQLGMDEMMDIQVFEGNPHFKHIHADQKGKALVVTGLAFTMAADLQGPWFCGHLRSRGLGRIRKAV